MSTNVVWLTPTDLAQKLKCSPRKIHDMRMKKLLPPARKIGGSLRWVESEIDEWFLSQMADH
jgi:predicted DNA-binding transcriptional regulator AlpA